MVVLARSFGRNCIVHQCFNNTSEAPLRRKGICLNRYLHYDKSGHVYMIVILVRLLRKYRMSFLDNFRIYCRHMLLTAWAGSVAHRRLVRM